MPEPTTPPANPAPPAPPADPPANQAPPAVVPQPPGPNAPPGGPPVAAPPPPADPPAKPKVRLTTGEEEIPEDADLLEMSKSALAARIARAKRSDLRERFGTDNPDEIKAKLDQLAAYEADREKARLASLSELDREKEARARAEKDAESWKTRYEREQEERKMAREGERIHGALAAHLKQRKIGVAIPSLATHLAKSMTQKELDALDDAQLRAKVDEWVVGTYLAESPEDALDYEDKLRAGAAPPPPAVVRKPLTNGADTNQRPAAPRAAQDAPNFSPSGPNAMTSRQSQAEAGKLGYSWK